MSDLSLRPQITRMPPPGRRGLMRSAMRASARRALHLAPTTLWRRLFPKREVGVCYHLVADVRPAHLKHYPVLSRAAFEADLDHLQSRYGVIGYADLLARRAGASPVRDNAAILTFDDGFAECATVIAPILKQRGLGGVFFVITDLIDNGVLFHESKAALCIDQILARPVEAVEAIMAELGLGARLAPPPTQPAFSGPGRSPLDLAGLDAPDPRLAPLLHWLLTLKASDAAALDPLCERLGVEPEAYLRSAQPYLTRDQILALHADGFTIGAHSRSHRYLGDLSPREAEAEIVESCRVIHEITGQASVPFAFPYFGGRLDRAWLAELRRRHDLIGLYFDTDGLREDEPFVVQRVFGERFTRDATLEAILRRAWAQRPAWRRRSDALSSPGA